MDKRQGRSGWARMGGILCAAGCIVPAALWGRTVTETATAIADDGVSTVTVAFGARGEEDADADQALYVAWAAEDKGEDIAAWTGLRRVQVLPDEAGSATLALPAAAFAQGRPTVRAFIVASGAPYDHLVESVRATGTQYFDTGCLATPLTVASAVIRYNAFNVQNRQFGVSYDSGTDGLSFDTYINGGGNWASALSDGKGDWLNTDVPASVLSRLRFTLDAPARTHTVALADTGATVASKTRGSAVQNTSLGSVYVLAQHVCPTDDRADYASNCSLDANLYSFTMATGGVMQCDWVPCVRGGRAGMYDRVTKGIVWSATETDFEPAGANVSDALLEGETVLAAGEAAAFAAADPEAGAVWKGTASGIWDFAAANWTVDGTPGQAWTDGLAAILNVNAATFAVTLGAAVQPAVLRVEGGVDYVLAGSGLSGAGGLVKTGGGKLTITGTHGFTGDVLLAGGETALTADNDVSDVTTAALGNPRPDGGRTVVVSNATLRVMGKNSLASSGRSATPITMDLKLPNAVLEGPTNFALNVGSLYLSDSEIRLHGALDISYSYPGNVQGPFSGSWWGSLFARNIYLGGSRAFTLNPNDSADGNNGRLKSAWSIGFKDEQGTIDVPKLVAGADASDAVFNIPLAWISGKSGDPNAGYAASGFRKTGAGVLEFARADDQVSTGYSTYTGNVDIVEGTWKLSKGLASVSPARSSAFGAQRYAHTVTVHPGARIWLNAPDLMGQALAEPSNVTLVVSGAKLQQSQGVCNALGPTVFEDATLSYNGYPTDSNYQYRDENGEVRRVTCAWPTFAFPCGVAFKGTAAYSLPGTGGATVSFGGGTGGRPSDLWVDEITGQGVADDKADVTLNVRLVDMPIWYARTWKADGAWIVGTNAPARAFNMRKTGPGMLVLGDKESTTTGRVEVAAGTLRFATRARTYTAGTDFDYPAAKSALGDLTDPSRVALVVSGGAVELVSSDTFGQASCENESVFVVSNGTLRSTGAWANALPRLALYDATLEYDGGLNGGHYNAPYGTFIFARRVSWDGTRPYDLQPNGQANYFALGHELDAYAVVESNGAVTNLHGKVAFEVADITGDARADVTLGVVLKTQASWNNGTRWGATRFWTGLVKAGPGTLALNGADPEGKYYTEATRVEAGALLVDTAAFKSTNVLVAAGAWLGGTGAVARATLAAGAGLTAAPGQTRPLGLGAVELEDPSAPVVVNVPCLGDPAEVQHLRVPVANAAGGLATARFAAVVNGGEALPPGHTARAFVQGGVVYGTLSRTGLAVILR